MNPFDDLFAVFKNKMLKKNMGVAVVIATILTFAIGYALFSQTINITGTATVSGSFEITPTCSTGIMTGISDNAATIIGAFNTATGMSVPTTERGYTSDSCSITNINTGSFTKPVAIKNITSMYYEQLLVFLHYFLFL